MNVSSLEFPSYHDAAPPRPESVTDAATASSPSMPRKPRRPKTSPLYGREHRLPCLTSPARRRAPDVRERVEAAIAQLG